MRCARKMGRGVCGGRVEIVVLRGGATAPVCEWCERQARGICRECPASVRGTIGKAIRCELHWRAAQHAHQERYRAEHRDKINAKANEYAKAHRERRVEYKRLWRAAFPSKVKAQKRRESLRNKARRREWHRRYNATHKPHPRTAPRTCLTCPTELSGRAKKCDACKTAALRTAKAKLFTLVA